MRRWQAFIVVPLIIGSLLAAFGLLGYFLGQALGLPARLELPVWLRALGGGVLAVGFAFMRWLYRYRKPGDVIVSTYLSMRSAIGRSPVQAATGRTEPLVLQGPQRHVRHPLYFANVVLIFGWWLVLDYTFIMFMAFFMLLWFNLVVIPFEEKELRALYGEQYEAYAKAVPRFIPALRCRWPSEPSPGAPST